MELDDLVKQYIEWINLNGDCTDPKDCPRFIDFDTTNNVCDYKLILTDCSMPFVDGYTCTRLMRIILHQAGFSDMRKQPKILAVTGHIEFEYQLKAFVYGME
mmetsp:Transcript_2746/g.4309  ORF Transcript_2746/g.4309 Transcript_2746/m.4309 type:complete len:102 (+) Transcript_2746:3068-3373(+)